MKPIFPNAAKDATDETAQHTDTAGAPTETGQKPEKVDAAPAVPEAPPRTTGLKTSAAAPNADVKADVAKAAAPVAKTLAAQQFRFISVYPNLTIYIYAGLREMVDGRERPAPTRIRFKNGGFFTSDPTIGKAIMKHPKCNTQLFRHVESAATAAQMVVSQQAAETMRTPTFHGATSSGDGGEQEFLQREAILKQQQSHAFHS